MSDSGADTQKRKRDVPEQRRISHACLPCRRRKIKCGGTKPCCQNCLRLKDKCQWPGHEGDDDVVTVADGIANIVNVEQRRVLLEIFFAKPHLDIMRQSVHRLSFESAEINQQSEFLLASIYCLSALYVSESDVCSVFNGESAVKLSQRLANTAQKCSRDTSDQPTVQSTQANLLLGFRELLCRTGYKAWMYIGVAIRMSQALRLGREYHQRHSSREQEVRRRTAWTCFILDKLVASVCSRPQTMRAVKIRAQFPCPERSFLFGEEFSGPASFLDTGPDPDTSEVLPYFIKAIEHWGVMTDISAASLQVPPSQATDSEGEFYKAEAAVMTWKRSLPSRMQWSLANYRAHRLLGQGSMFVSLHFILNHCLCAAHQEYLPEFEGDPAFDDASSPEPSSSRRVVKTCLAHADEITRMASLLYTGDETDREMLQAPFAGLALESAACCLLWRIHRESQSFDTEGTFAVQHQNHETVKRKLGLVSNILKSWSDVWPIATAWYETIDLLSRLYQAANPSGTMELDENGLGAAEESGPLSSGDISIGSGYPYPQNLKSHRMFDNIRMIIMTASDPPGLRNHQTRLHIQSLWDRMFLSQQIIPSDVDHNTIRNDRAEAVLEFENFSTLDDMLNFMDDFQGFDSFDSTHITGASHSAANQQHSSPFP